MALGYLDDSKLYAIASAIRAKTGDSATMTVDDMPDEIESIETGGGEPGPFHDGLTHFVVHVPNDGFEISMNMYCGTIGGGSIDWGDGVTDGWPYAGRGDISHTYAQSGIYDIKIIHTEDQQFRFGGSGPLESLFKLGNVNGFTYRQRPLLRYAEISNNDRLMDYAFFNCIALEKVLIDGAYPYTGDYAFSGCSSINNILGINAYSSLEIGYFQYCYLLTSIQIPDTQTTIYSTMFSCCFSLQNVEIPAGVTSIKARAFEYCLGLQYVRLKSLTPPSLANTNAFSSTNNCPIYVPAAAVESYKAATNWSTYASRIMADPES